MTDALSSPDLQARILVCVSSHPVSEVLVKKGAELAAQSHLEWDVVYVETPDRLRYSPSHRDRLARILELAEAAGARVRGISGRSIAQAVCEYARENGVVRILVGKPLRPRWRELLWPSPVDEIIRCSPPADVLVVGEPGGPLKDEHQRNWLPHAPLNRYLFATLLVALVSLVAIPVHLAIDPTNLVMLFLLAVIVSAFFWGRGPAMLASLLGVVVFDFFFVNPRLSLTVEDTEYVLTFLGLLGVGLVVSSLAGLVRDQAETARRREARAAMMYDLSRELTITPDLDAVLKKIIQQVEHTVERGAFLLLPGQNGLELRASSPGLVLTGPDFAAAEWAYETGKPFSFGTAILTESTVRWFPLVTSEDVVGLLGVHLASPSAQLPPGLQQISPEQRQLLDAYSNLAALAIERAALNEKVAQNRILVESEKLQSALLSSLSHDLRTPLASITGVFSSLYEAEKSLEMTLEPAARLDLLETGWQESERLNRLVGNLLDMTRLEAGGFQLNWEKGDIEDVIGAALARLRRRLQEFKVVTHLASDRTLVTMDLILIEQVLVNLLDNAAKFSPPGGEIEIGVEFGQSRLKVWVADRGPGIDPEDLDHIFDKFVRGRRTGSTTGSGLGLSICKGIVEAHQGFIKAENRKDGGAMIFFTIPYHREPTGSEEP